MTLYPGVSVRLDRKRPPIKQRRDAALYVLSRPQQPGQSDRARYRELRVALVAHACWRSRCSPSEVIKPTLDVQDMRVVVSYVSTGELVQLQWKYGAHIDRREIRAGLPARLLDPEDEPRDGRQDVRDLPARTSTGPDKVDDDGTLTLGHELLHCMLGELSLAAGGRVDWPVERTYVLSRCRVPSASGPPNVAPATALLLCSRRWRAANG